MPQIAAKICRVSGRVQGVFYRASAQQQASRLGIRGYAKNLMDGRVEVLAIGEPKAVEQFVQWLWQGSPLSAVSTVEIEEIDATGLIAQSAFTTS